MRLPNLAPVSYEFKDILDYLNILSIIHEGLNNSAFFSLDKFIFAYSLFIFAFSFCASFSVSLFFFALSSFLLSFVNSSRFLFSILFTLRKINIILTLSDEYDVNCARSTYLYLQDSFVFRSG